MKGDAGLRKRPTFEEVANIVNKDPYKLDLPSRTYIRWEDTPARIQFEQFRDATAEAEQTRLWRQGVEARIKAPQRRFQQRRAAPDQTLLTTGEVQSAPETQSTGKNKK